MNSRKNTVESGNVSVSRPKEFYVPGTKRKIIQLTSSDCFDYNRIIFCHPPTETGVLMTDLRGGHYIHLRARKNAGRPVCHYLATGKGIMYEAGNRFSGIYNPAEHTCVEYDLGLYGYVHTGRDPEARLWFYECHDRKSDRHGIFYFPYLTTDDENRPKTLIPDMRTYWSGQRSHFHPALTPDRKHILFTGGDATNGTNHLFLLDVSDLDDTELTCS